MVTWEYCGKSFDPSEGAWDDGDYMCGERISAYVESSEQEKGPAKPPRNPRSKAVRTKTKP
jgi:hypothetical protein